MKKFLFIILTVFSLKVYCNPIATPDTVSGYAYIDLNNNGIWDPGEPALANQPITISPAINTVITDSNGFYAFICDSGVLETIKPDSLRYAAFSPDSINVLLGNPVTDTGNLNFGFHYVDTFSDARVFATEVIRAIPGQGVEYHLTLNNHGARAENGTLIFIFDSHFTYNSSTPAAILSGDTLKWSFSNLPVAVYANYSIKMTTNSSAPLGTVFNDTTYVSIIDSDAFPANNLAVITDTIVNSYQRNNKTVWPANYNGADFQAGDYLNYNITFQNTSNLTVGHVWIIDTLSPYLDMSTLSVVAASAPYALTINGHALRVDFFNIGLFDSTVSQLGSHGFFKFAIRPLSLNFIGPIQNTAYIYLDGILYTVGAPCNVCLSQLNIYVNTNPEIFPDCQSPTLGSANVTVTSGTSPYIYAWSNGSSNTTISNLAHGQYYVTVTDNCVTTAIGMPYVDSLRQVQIVDTVIIITQPTCTYSTNGSAAAIPCGGNGPYSYRWSNGQTTDTATNLMDSIQYYCTITDASGDSSVDSVLLSGLDHLNYQWKVVNCGGDTVWLEDYGNPNPNLGWAEIQPYGGTPPYNVQWNTGGFGEFPYSDSGTIYNLPSGSYSVTVSDLLGCSITQPFNIQTAYDTIKYLYLFTIDDCQNNNSTTVFFSVVADQLDFDTFYGPPAIFYANPQSDTITGSITISYYGPLLFGYPFVQAYNNGISCGLDTFPEEYFDFTDIWTSVVSEPTCNNDTTGIINVSIYDQGLWPFTFSSALWSNGDMGSQPTNFAAGTYTVTVTGEGGCTASATATISASDLLSDTATVKNVLCYGDSNGSIKLVAINGSGSYTYNWSNGQQLAGDTALSPGNYTCTITDGTGCSVLSTSAVLQPDSLYLEAVIVPIPCYRGTGDIELTPYGGTLPYSYTWSSNNGFGNQVYAGAYFVTVTDANGCAFSDTFVLTQPTPLQVIANTNQTLACYGDDDGNISLSVSGGTPPYSYHWNNFFTGDDQNSLTAGTYSYTVTDSNGCAVHDTLIITQPDSFSIVINSTDPSCFDSANGSISLSVSGGAGNYTYRWSNNAGSSTIAILPAGNYSCTITDGTGCTITDSFTIVRPDSVSALFSLQEPDCGAATGFIELDSAHGGAPPYTLHWSNGDTGTSISNISSGVYYVTITDNNGCVYTYSNSVPCITGIENIASGDILSMYPNPASTVLYINSTQKRDYELLLRDVTGRIVQQLYFTQSTVLNVAGLSHGIYMAEIYGRDNDQLTVKKIVLQ